MLLCCLIDWNNLGKILILLLGQSKRTTIHLYSTLVFNQYSLLSCSVQSPKKYNNN